MTDAIVQQHLCKSGLRPTRQRLTIGSKLWSGRWATETRHFTAEQLHSECMQDDSQVSMATVYNTLHQFVKVGLLREVVVDSSRSYFDTNIDHHYHMLDEDTGQLLDIPSDKLTVSNIPIPEAGKQIKSIDVVIRVESA